MIHFLLFLLCQSALAQDQWRLVDQDGHIETAWSTLHLTNEQKSHLRFAWAWSGVTAPRRVEGERIGEAGRGGSPPRLLVRLVRSAAGRPPADSRVIAAPIAMWQELPEDRLPSWPVPASGRLALPFDPQQRWRLRVAASGEGTWWVDLPPGKSEVVLAPVAATGIEVAVTRPDGEPVAPVIGAVLEGAPRQGRSRAWAGFRGEGGRIAFPGLPDLDEVTVSVLQPGFTLAALHGRPGELPARLSRGAIAQSLSNLLDNAVKYSHGATEITVGMRRDGPWAVVWVRDYGIGIPRDEQTKIFERFHRVGTSLVHDVKGSGLGLSIVQHIVQAHGGRVTVESRPGEGSTFSLHLPLDPPAAQADARGKPLGEPPGTAEPTEA